MVMHIEHEDDDARIEVNPGFHLARLTWKAPVPGPRYRAVLLRLMEVVERNGLTNWLSDGRRMGPILYADQAWTMQELVPKLVSVGMKRIAIVSSEDVLNQIAVDRMVGATPADVPYAIAFFEDPSIAQLWLMDKSGAQAAVPG